MSVKSPLNLCKRFYYHYLFKIVKKESKTQLKLNATLSYNITWGLSLVILLLQAYSIYNELDPVFYTIFPVFVGLYSITVYLLLVHQIWRFVIHLYCVFSLITLWIEIYARDYMLDVSVMLYATVVVFLSFSLLHKVFANLYISIALLTVFIYLLKKHPSNYYALNYNQSWYTAFYSMVMMGFVAFVCYHFTRSMYLVIKKIQFATQKKKMLIDRLVQMTESTQQSLKTKEEFLSTMSHELRSPLNTVIGFATLLEEEPLNNRQKDNLNCLQHSAVNLLDLINDVLDYNKFESGNLILERGNFTFKEILFAPDAVFQEKIRKEQIHLKTNVDVHLIEKCFLGDEIRMIQMLFNLIFVAHTGCKKGKIELELHLGNEEAAAQTEVHICLVFKGLNKYMSRLQNEDNAAKGLFDDGMGESLLYLRTSIAQKIVQAMNGDFRYTYDPVSDTSHFCFSIFMTVANQSVACKSVPNTTEIHLNGMKILVVDDNELNVLLITKILKKMGAIVKVAHNGHSAIELTYKQPFDLVLMDLNMPELSGIEASRIIKSMQDSVRIIALTGESKADKYPEIIEAGMDGFLEKPIDLKTLLKEIDRVSRLNFAPIQP